MCVGDKVHGRAVGQIRTSVLCYVSCWEHKYLNIRMFEDGCRFSLLVFMILFDAVIVQVLIWSVVLRVLQGGVSVHKVAAGRSY